MKLLLVDDEKHVITALRRLIPAERFHIDEILSTQSYEEAKVLLEKERPEIAIVDIILQNHFGTGLMSFVQNKRLPTQIIAISGHSDYEYVRAMLINGAIDYLLKPIEPSALNAALEKAAARIAAHSAPDAPKGRPAVRQDQLSHSIRQFLTGLLDEGESDELRRKWETQALPFSGLERCTLLYYSVDAFPMCSTAFEQHLNGFEEKIRHHLAVSGSGFFLRRLGGQNTRILLFAQSDRHLLTVRNILLDAFGMNLLSFHMGCVRSFSFPQDFRDAFLLAQQCFLSADCHTVTEILSETPYFSRRETLMPGSPLIRDTLSCIVIADADGLFRLLQQWLSPVLATDSLPLGLVFELIDCFQDMRRQWIARLQAEFPDFAPPPQDSITYANLLDEHLDFSCDMLTASFAHHARSFALDAAGFLEEKDLFQRIALYIRLNYDKPFSQTEYARLFHINRDYLSRKFKSIHGEGMVSYVNRLRIEEAARLLSGSSLRIREIAFQTGFSDEKYFTKQFKAAMNILPSDYRALMNPDFRAEEEP